MRMRCSMNHAVFWVTPKVRCSSQLEIPFLSFTIAQTAGNHFSRGIAESSITVPTFTEN